MSTDITDKSKSTILVTRISKILEVSLDELLSDDDMEKMVKRNPIIEKPVINNMILLLYGAIAVLYISTILDLIIRLPSQPVSNVLWVCVLMLHNLIGTIASIKYFVQSNTKKVWIVLLSVTCISGMLRLIFQIYHMIVYSGDYLTMNMKIWNMAYFIRKLIM